MKYCSVFVSDALYLKFHRLEFHTSASFSPAQANPHNYDAWFDYLRLVESDADAETVREVYERAIANTPPIQEKRHWRRYIYLWINYALYEELEVKVRQRVIQLSFISKTFKSKAPSAQMSVLNVFCVVCLGP